MKTYWVSVSRKESDEAIEQLHQMGASFVKYRWNPKVKKMWMYVTFSKNNKIEVGFQTKMDIDASGGHEIISMEELFGLKQLDKLRDFSEGKCKASGKDVLWVGEPSNRQPVAPKPVRCYQRVSRNGVECANPIEGMVYINYNDVHLGYEMKIKSLEKKIAALQKK